MTNQLCPECEGPIGAVSYACVMVENHPQPEQCKRDDGCGETPCICRVMSKPITDRGQDGCGECDVCRYLDFLEWAGQVAPAGSTIERNPEIEKYLDASHPGWR